MKILSAKTVYSSDHQKETMDLNLHEKTQKTEITKSRIQPREDDRENNPAQNTIRARGRRRGRRILRDIWMDRISIEKRETQSLQSNYSANLSSRSTVQNILTGDITEHSQDTLVEKIVGGLIDKSVVITKLERGEDVSLAPNSDFFAGDIGISQTRSNWQMSIEKTDIHFEDENTSFASTGKVTTEDGRVIDFELDLSMNRTFLSRTEEKTLVERWQERVTLTDPLVVSLDGRVPELSDTRFEFDLDSDGFKDQVNFVSSGSGFLAFDKNQDQVINDGSELFGPGTGNGFEELAAYDEDQNAWIDENDAVFSQLSVWTKDADGNDQLISLKDAGIGAINLDYAATAFDMTQADNGLLGKMQRTGVFLFEDGRAGSVHQIDLVQHEKEPKPGVVLTPEGPLLPENTNEEAALVMEPPPMVDQPQTEMAENPLAELMERIEQIKEEMEKLYESMNPVNTVRNARRRGRVRELDLKLDPTVLLSGHHIGRGRRANRYL